MDAYDYKARLAPITVVAAPLLLLGVALFGVGAWRAGAGILIGVSGLHLLLMQFVRDRGFSKQESLFQQWGGSPTIQLLRWSGASNPILVERRHTEVSRATGTPLPTATEEAFRPTEADLEYGASIALLRDRTRTSDFQLVSRQNANYGYRRNLYGCRKFGITVSVCVAVAGAGFTFFPVGAFAHVDRVWMIATAILSAGWIAVWIVGVTSEFVRRAAEQYANSLIEAAGRLPEA